MEKGILTLFEVSVTMAVLIILMMLTKPLAKKRYATTVRYVMWLFIAIRLILPFNISLPNSVTIELPNQNINYTPVFNPNLTNQSNPIAETSSEYTKYVSVKTEETSVNKEVSIYTILFIVWLIGCSISLIHQLVNYFKFSRLIKRSQQPVNAHTELIFNSLFKDERLQIMESKCLSSPLLIGLIHPKIVLNTLELSDTQLKMILKHEVVHFQRHDILFKWLLMIASCIHWFNPFVYVMMRNADKDIEFSCDEIVLRNKNLEYRKEYGYTILQVLQNQVIKSNTVLSTRFNQEKKTVKERLLNLIDMKKKSSGKKIVLVSLILTIIASTLVSCSKSVYKETTTAINESVTLIETEQEMIYEFYDNTLTLSYRKDGPIEFALVEEITNDNLHGIEESEVLGSQFISIVDSESKEEITSFIVAKTFDYIQDYVGLIYGDNGSISSYKSNEMTQENVDKVFGNIVFKAQGEDISLNRAIKEIESCAVIVPGDKDNAYISILYSYPSDFRTKNVNFDFSFDVLNTVYERARFEQYFDFEGDLFKKCNLNTNGRNAQSLRSFVTLNGDSLEKVKETIENMEFEIFNQLHEKQNIKVDNVYIDSEFNQPSEFEKWPGYPDNQKLDYVLNDEGKRVYRLQGEFDFLEVIIPNDISDQFFVGQNGKYGVFGVYYQGIQYGIEEVSEFYISKGFNEGYTCCESHRYSSDLVQELTNGYRIITSMGDMGIAIGEAEYELYTIQSKYIKDNLEFRER